MNCAEDTVDSPTALPVSSYTYDPLVVPVGSLEAITLIVRTDGSETSLRVDLENGQELIPSYMGDNSYEASFSAEQVLYGYTAAAKSPVE